MVLVGPNRPMAVGTGGMALWRPLQSPPSPLPPGGPQLSDISGIGGWWDAGRFGGLLSPTGDPVGAWGQSAIAIANRVASGAPITSYSYAAPGRVPVATARLSGLLGGIGRFSDAGNLLASPLDPDIGFQMPTTGLSGRADSTWYFVWSRPNWRQGSMTDAGPITLVSIGGQPVLQADGSGGSGRLVLLTGAGQLVLAQTMNRRHTHCVLLRQQAGSGLDIWLDGVRVASFVMASWGFGAPVMFLHDGTSRGAAQCWFHEAAYWPRALSDAEIGQAAVYSQRWYLGARRGVVLLVDGQSNAVNFAINDGAATLLAKGVAWYLGALSYGVLATTGLPTSYTMQSGHGLYPAVGGSYPGSFLVNPGDGSDPSTWSLGADGLAVQQAVTTLSPEDRADICALIWPWNETDSLRDFSELGTFSAAARRFLSLERSMVGQSAGTLPLVWWNAIPYGGAGGMQMHRAAVAALAADPTQNVVVGNPQTSDSNARGAVWDPLTGVISGGDSAHRDSLDNQRFARLAAPVVARAVMAAGLMDSVPAIPLGIAQSGGPRIIHAYRQSNTTVILTIQHDAGSDLKVPLMAAQGAGFAVRDGGTPAAPGPIISAVSCTRIDATHLSVTLATPITSATSGCGLYYPYGSVSIGRGSAVTDNFSSVPKPDGWDIAADLGTAWALDFPLSATLTSVPLSDVP